MTLLPVLLVLLAVARPPGGGRGAVQDLSCTLVLEHRTRLSLALVERELVRVRDGEEEWIERDLPRWTLERTTELVLREELAGGSLRARTLTAASQDEVRRREGDAAGEDVPERRDRARSPLVGRTLAPDAQGRQRALDGGPPPPADLSWPEPLEDLLPADGSDREAWTVAGEALADLLLPLAGLPLEPVEGEEPPARSMLHLQARLEQARASLAGSLQARLRRDGRVALEGSVRMVVGERVSVDLPGRASGHDSQEELLELELEGWLRIENGRAREVHLAGAARLEREDVRTLGGERGEFELVALHRFAGRFELHARRRESGREPAAAGARAGEEHGEERDEEHGGEEPPADAARRGGGAP